MIKKMLTFVILLFILKMFVVSFFEHFSLWW